MKKQLFVLFLCSFLIIHAYNLSAQDAVTSGEFIVEPATLQNLGFEWKITGDDNRNATVAVQYRLEGTTIWKDAQPLPHIPPQISQ